MTPLLSPLLAAFTATYGAAASTVVRAPGRVNLIGEHTDYNDGFVLPCAIDYQTLVAARPRDDGQVQVLSLDYGGAHDHFRLDAPITARADAPWANYVRGVIDVLQRQGHVLRGADLAITGNVPQGAGLSSSAALEVAVLQAMCELNGLRIDLTDVALLAQRAENDFVGCQCGIMDQLISARGQAGHALLIDCRTLGTRPVVMPEGLAVMVVHSRVARGLVDSAYNERRQQCQRAAAHFGVAALRDLDLAGFERGADGLPALIQRRARHVITENQRTLDAAEALAAGQLRRLGGLMAQSHASMRDDFEITVPAIDQLVAIAQAAIGEQGGARMTGGGFGGCIVALMPQAAVAAVRQAIAQAYLSPSGEPALVWVCTAQDGVKAMAPPLWPALPEA